MYVRLKRAVFISQGVLAATAWKLSTSKTEDMMPVDESVSREVNDMAQKIGIHHPVVVYTSNKRGSCAFGLHTPFSEAAIVLANDDLHKPATRYHELSHIKHKDWIIGNTFFPWLTLMVATDCIPKIKGHYSPLIIFLFIAYARYVEYRADHLAIENCNAGEISTFFHDLSELAEENKYYCHTNHDYLQRARNWFYFDQHGNNQFISRYPFVDTHPSHTVRMRYFAETALAKEECANIEMYWSLGDEGDVHRQLVSKEEIHNVRKLISSSHKASSLLGLSKLYFVIFDDGCKVHLFIHGIKKPFTVIFGNDELDMRSDTPVLDVVSTLVKTPTLRFATLCAPPEIANGLLHDEKLYQEFHQLVTYRYQLSPDYISVHLLESKKDYRIIEVIGTPCQNTVKNNDVTLLETQLNKKIDHLKVRVL